MIFRTNYNFVIKITIFPFFHKLEFLGSYKPCVPLHGRFKICKWDVRRRRGGEGRKGKEKEKGKGMKGKEKGRKGKKKGRKEEKRKEENRRKRRKKEKGERKRKECRAVSRPEWQRSRNYAMRGKFPPTPVILRIRTT